jgi:hypothetical protein
LVKGRGLPDRRQHPSYPGGQILVRHIQLDIEGKLPLMTLAT